MAGSHIKSSGGLVGWVDGWMDTCIDTNTILARQRGKVKNIRMDVLHSSSSSSSKIKADIILSSLVHISASNLVGDDSSVTFK